MAKEWETAIGKVETNPGDADSLLAQTKTDRERKRIKRQEAEDEAEHTARMAELAKKTASSEAAVEKTSEKKEAESPFKFTGGVNLGTIDLQEERREAKERLEQMKQEADDATKATGQENQQLRDKIHAQEIAVLQITFQAQMDAVTKAIEAGRTTQKTFMEQWTEAAETAKILGYSQGTQQPGSEMIQLEMRKLDFEHQIAMRKMVKDDKASERQWQVELRRLDDERDARKAELAQAQKRDEFWANLPKILGDAGAAGLMARGHGSNPPITKTGSGKTRKAPGIIAGVGEGGTAECSECGEPIAIGPTARESVCSNCGTVFPIKRVKEVSSEEEE